KVYLHYEEGDDPELHMTLKLTLPKKWVDQSPVKVLDLFIESYNMRKPSHALDVAKHCLRNGSGQILCVNDEIGLVIKDREDIHVQGGTTPEGKPPQKVLIDRWHCPTSFYMAVHAPNSSPQTSSSSDGKLRCKNYGCNQFYTDSENGPDACSFHVKPPIFHDTKK
ncbi:unnamed protein product, partial [Chrysoparadoxa australica]